MFLILLSNNNKKKKKKVKKNSKFLMTKKLKFEVLLKLEKNSNNFN